MAAVVLVRGAKVTLSGDRTTVVPASRRAFFQAVMSECPIRVSPSVPNPDQRRAEWLAKEWVGKVIRVDPMPRQDVPDDAVF
jgi:hypothetical protein